MSEEYEKMIEQMLSNQMEWAEKITQRVKDLTNIQNKVNDSLIFILKDINDLKTRLLALEGKYEQ